MLRSFNILLQAGWILIRLFFSRVFAGVLHLQAWKRQNGDGFTMLNIFALKRLNLIVVFSG